MSETKTRQSVPPSVYTADYFLKACEGYEEFSETQGERLSRRLSQAFALAAVEPGMKVLDVGCGRGEILRHCARLGADAYGIDYAPIAVAMSSKVIAEEGNSPGQTGVARADAKTLPFPNERFDRVLMFDVVEHLYPWELRAAMAEVRRVLKNPDPTSRRPGGIFIVHTAPNAWYDRFAYPWVRLVRRAMGQGAKYPANPRAFNVAANVDVHVNEQSALSLWRALGAGGFRARVWLESPPQNRREGRTLAALRKAAFDWPPFRWFFQREVFAVGEKR